MTSGQKIAASILTTVIIFVCFAVAAFAGLFTKIEARFYEPAKIASIRKQLNSVADSSDSYIHTLLEKFGIGTDSFVANSAVASYASQSPSDSDVQERTRLTGNLFSETAGLDGIRLIDQNGRSVHFSTYQQDILRQTETMRMYKNYDELRTPSGEVELPFDSISAPDASAGGAKNYKLAFDGTAARIVFSFPFYDAYSVYRGTMIFYVNAQDFNRTLIMQNVISMNDSCVLISSKSDNFGGFVFGMPNVGREVIESGTIAKWQTNSTGPDRIVSIEDSGDEEAYWILISDNSGTYVKIGGVYRDSVFVMPHVMQMLLLVCVFITLFLVVFLIFNARRDDMIVIRDKIKRFELGLINEYLENKESVDWNDVAKKIASHQSEVTTAIKQSLGNRAKRHEQETDELINRSWNEIINALNVKSGGEVAAHAPLQDSQEIRRMLEEILRSGSITVSALGATREHAEQAGSVMPVGETEVLEEAEAVEAAEQLEEAEVVDEVEVLEEVEQPEEAEVLEEVEQSEEAEAVEAVEQLEEAEVVEEAEAVDEVEVLEEVEQSEEAEAVEAVEQLEEAEVVEEVEVLEEADAVEEAEVLEEVAAVQEVVDIDALMSEYDEITDELGVHAGNAAESQDAAEKDDSHALDDFSVAAPNFLFLDEDFSEAQKDGRQKTDNETHDVEPLEKDAALFTFAPFGISKPIQEAPLSLHEAIVEDDDGVYTISPDLEIAHVEQDMMFKQLVDSVLR